MKSWRYKIAAALLYAFAAFGTIQIVNFGSHAAETTYIYALEAVRLASTENDERLGQICNSIGRLDCAIRVFSKLQLENPGRLEDMSNLAVALTKANRISEALPYYQAYVAGGGADDSVVRWYAQALVASGAIGQAIPWYYRALSADVHNRELAAELLEALNKIGRVDEALSLREQMSDIGHYSAVAGSSEEKSLEPTRGLASENAAAEKDSTTDSPVKEYYFPSLDGRNFLLPFHSGHNASEFIAADPDRKNSVINEVDLARWGLAPRVNGAGRVMVKELKIGPLTIHDAELETCDECKTVLGADTLAKAAGRVDTRNKIALLILTDSD